MRSTQKALLGFVLLLAVAQPLGAWERDRSAPAPGPVYVPLDSWIYPAFRRLASLGYLPDADTLILPWTRRDCALLVEEAEDIESRRSTRISAGHLNAEARVLIKQLRAEFAGEREQGASAGIESLYFRSTEIAGKPLNDSYHFGQTLNDDFGRPFAAGLNTIAGISGYATAGRFSAYVRGEYQQSPGSAAYDATTRNFIAQVDGTPITAARNTSANRGEALEAYVGTALGPFDMTFGRQSMWWGPGESSALHFSNNAQPIDGLRLSQSSPLLLPGPLRRLGRIRTAFLFGRLDGHQFPPRPWINAQKITLQVTEDLEIGCTRSAIFGGVGHPLTAGSILRSFFSVTSPSGGVSDPGDRRGGFDFRWFLPKLRRRVTVYSDSLADDDPNPLANPRRAAWAPGLYLTSFPRFSHLDLRFETYSTWLYRKDEGGRFIYWNDQYQDAYTNNDFVLGSWVGRDARAYTASSTYWFSGQNTLTAAWRQIKTGSNFLPGGGTQSDVSLAAQWRLGREWLASASIQGERWNIPVLGGMRRDFTAQFQVTWYPRDWAVHHP